MTFESSCSFFFFFLNVYFRGLHGAIIVCVKTGKSYINGASNRKDTMNRVDWTGE